MIFSLFLTLLSILAIVHDVWISPIFCPINHLLRSHDRAIVLEPGNPSTKSQTKALAAVEGNFCFAYCIYELIFP